MISTSRAGPVAPDTPGSGAPERAGVNRAIFTVPAAGRDNVLARLDSYAPLMR